MIDKSPMQPYLFGLKHSNRDFTKHKSWGKNQFNSSFPAALACYMGSKNINPIYLKVNNDLTIDRDEIPISRVLGLDYNSPHLFFAFERDYLPYQNLVIGTLPRVDLVTMDTEKDLCLQGLEIKLTALPDHTTCNLPEDRYSCELVVRPPTIIYLSISFAKTYQNDRENLLAFLQPVCSKIKDWTDPKIILALLPELIETIDIISKARVSEQFPIVMQPIWKTEGKSAKLCDRCLDIIMWSNFAFTRLFIEAAKSEINHSRISRHKRCVAWFAKMLYDFATGGKINYEETIDEMSFNTKNDKAFALSGMRTYQYMKSPILTNPRIRKNEIKNIILGGGELLLSPERRFDAVILNTPGLFD
ncbi:MAG: HindVP family restriction endonuclease [Cyanobacteria bacterium P01_E01_bin.42]